MRIMLAADVLVTIVIGGATTAWAVSSPQPDIILLAAVTWIFIAAAWTFAVINRRGCWSPAALDTAAFVDLSIRRARGAIAATTFGAVLYFAEIVFCLAWIYQHAPRHGPAPLRSFLVSDNVLVVWFATLAFVGLVVWYRRRKRSELSYLLDLQRQTCERPR
jgi:hypothetical protein